jgi:hypothetical protein
MHWDAGLLGKKIVARLKNRHGPVLRDMPETSYEVLQSKLRYLSKCP